MKQYSFRLFALLTVLALVATFTVQSVQAAPGDDLIITGVLDGPLSGGTPKAVELYAVNAIPDLSIYGLSSANNGGGATGMPEFDFPADSAAAGEFIYVASEEPQFLAWFGFTPNYTNGVANINGDDAIELFTNGIVSDVFGDVDVDGTGQPWEYMDGWAYRVDNTGPDGSTFVLGNWMFSGINALDGETSNATAETPFPDGSYTRGASANVLINEFEAKGTEWIELYNAGAAAQDLTGWYVESSDGTMEALSGSLAAGAYLDFDTTLPLDNSGDSISLYDGSDTLIDSVAYGDAGGAPLMNTGYSTARLFDGVDTDDDARDFNLDATPTRGAANDVPGTALGSSVFVNEVDLFPAAGPDYVELYNPSGSAIDVTGWSLSDGDDIGTFSGSVPAGGFLVLEEIVDFPGDFGSSDVAYLYNASGERVDQLGWEGEFVDDCVARVPDGAGPSDGYNWVSSDGGVSVFDQPCTIGSSNGSGPSSPLVINEILADPLNVQPPTVPNGDANNDGVADSGEDEFLELVNISGGDLDLADWTVEDEASVRHTFPANSIVPDSCSVVIFGGGSPTGAFGGSVVQTASSGALGFNNGGDTITVTNPSMTTTIVYTYGSEGGDNQSLTRDPDITGAEPLVKHATATGSDGAIFSPGTMIDGTAFVGCPTSATPATIEDIQFTTDPSGDSPLVGQLVETNGIVYATYPNAGGDSGFAIHDASGPWHGVYVVTGDALPAIGDDVTVTGTVTEFFGRTQLAGPTWSVNSSGNALFAQSDVLTVDIATGAASAESYEGVLVAVQNILITNGDAGFGEWEIDDGSGATLVDDYADYTFVPMTGQELVLVRGMLNYSFGDFKIEPRDDDDIVEAPFLGLSKDAPANVLNGETMTYTLTVENGTLMELTTVVISDVLPANTVYVGGGTLNGDTVTWSIPSIADGASVSVDLQVMAIGPNGTVITNDTYAVVASNYPTPTYGSPVITIIGSYTPAYVIQGSGFASPFVGSSVTSEGVVTGFFEGNASSSSGGDFDGFFMQDATGDGDPATSDGIFIYYDDAINPGVAIGDSVSVMGIVQEFSEWDGDSCVDSCVTQIDVAGAGDISVIGTGSITAEVLMPVTDIDEMNEYLESKEGMLMTQPGTATVVGPTSFGTIFVIDSAEGVERVLRLSPEHGKQYGVRNWEKFGDINGGDAPGLIVSSVVENVDGPLTTTYGNYAVITQANDAWSVVSSTPPPVDVPTWPSAGVDEFTIATFNTLNFDQTGGVHLDKVVDVIDTMGGPTFIAVQEIDVASVMADVIAALNTLGYPYDYGFSHPDVGGHGVAVMWRTDQVSSATWTDEYQGCSVNGSSSSTAYDNFCDAVPGEFPLFSRRPVVLMATVATSAGDADVVVIANHFKSKLGGVPSDLRRVEQGAFVGDLAAGFMGTRGPGTTPYVIVAGDLNDFEDSPPLDALYAAGMQSTWPFVPATESYSYIFNGVSQILDHVLISPALVPWLTDVAPLHIDADFPFLPYSADGSFIWRTSDHDPVIATLRLPDPTAVTIGDISATVADGTVTFAWETLAEINTLGFNVLRSAELNGTYEQVNANLIAALAGTGNGMTYSITDQPANGIWYYMLEEIDISGTATRYPAVMVDTYAPTAVSLTGINGADQSVLLPLLLSGLMLAVLGGWMVMRKRDA
jgi:uncharacterized repeat protein (TIGR01451 family)